MLDSAVYFRDTICDAAVTNCKFVNISAKSDIPKDILWDGKLLFLVLNDDNMLSSTFPDNFLSADC